MPKKISQFEAERQNILVELLQILEINENNNKFFLDELDNNIIKQNSIIGLVDSVKKYFNCGKWSCFVNINVKRYYFSLIKYILKYMNYKLLPSKTSKKIAYKKYKCVTYYNLVKNI
jgi:hypothetical protein